MKYLKTLLIVSFLAIASSVSAQQLSKNSIGFRVGHNDGFGGELSYQRYLDFDKRIELDLGMRERDNVDIFKVVGLYQSVRVIDDNLRWYGGLGGGYASYETQGFDGNYIFVAANAGIEYTFNFPVAISLDVQPEVSLNDDFYDVIAFDIALGVRYRF
jgi:opacity protein-like surface antigen